MNDASSSKLFASASTWSLFRRFWVYARPHKRWILFGMAMIPGSRRSARDQTLGAFGLR